MDELIEILADLVIEEINQTNDYMKAQHLIDVGLIYQFIHKYILSL